MSQTLKEQIKELKLECRHFHRQNELLIAQISHNINIVRGQEVRITELESLSKDDYK